MVCGITTKAARAAAFVVMPGIYLASGFVAPPVGGALVSQHAKGVFNDQPDLIEV